MQMPFVYASLSKSIYLLPSILLLRLKKAGVYGIMYTIYFAAGFIRKKEAL